MSKMLDEHLKSIDRTLTIMRIHLNRQKVPKYQKELERDIHRLEQIREAVAGLVTAPMFDNIVDAVCELAI